MNDKEIIKDWTEGLSDYQKEMLADMMQKARQDERSKMITEEGYGKIYDKGTVLLKSQIATLKAENEKLKDENGLLRGNVKVLSSNPVCKKHIGPKIYCRYCEVEKTLAAIRSKVEGLHKEADDMWAVDRLQAFNEVLKIIDSSEVSKLSKRKKKLEITAQDYYDAVSGRLP